MAIENVTSGVDGITTSQTTQIARLMHETASIIPSISTAKDVPKSR